jgi:acyl carrier protein
MPTLEEITFNVEEIASDSGGGIEISSLECSFYEDLGYDSLDLVDFMMKEEG